MAKVINHPDSSKTTTPDATADPSIGDPAAVLLARVYRLILSWPDPVKRLTDEAQGGDTA